MPCRIEMLGGLRVLQLDAKIDRFQSQKTGALLAFLALNMKRSHGREALAEMLWPEGDPRAIRNRLNQAISSLRRQLHPPESPAMVLVTDHHFVGLNTEAVTTDVGDFTRDLKMAGHEQNRARKLELLEKAVGRYGGELLSGYFEDWVLPERLRLADLYSEALVELVTIYSKAGEPERALEFAHARHKLDPLDAEPHLQLMDLYLRADRPRSALQQHEQMTALFAEAGIPLPESADTFQRRATKDAHKEYVGVRAGKASTAEASEPPSRRRESHAAPLPRVFTKFVGREEEIASIIKALDDGADLVTILGVGGCGKTRLAIEAGLRLNDEYDGNVLFIPFANVTDPDQVLPEIARYVLSEGEGVNNVEWDLFRALNRMGDVLLILDNFEQLAEEGGHQVKALLARATTTQCLVTSRHALSGEVLLQLRPLPIPKPDEDRLLELASNPSIALFVSRAQAVRPDFQLTERTAPGIAALCRKLEGLPLALELAAGWSRVLTPSQMLEQVSQRFDLLESRRKDISARHRSMRAAIDGSFELLSPELRETFVRLGIFPGSFTLEAAKYLCPSEDLVSQLESLIERSLIRSDETSGGLRFSMLETLQAYARAQMSADVAADCGWLHADYYRRLVMQEMEFVSWREGIDREGLNVFVALDWLAANKHESDAVDMAIALRPYWEAKGRVREGRERLEGLLEEAPASVSASQRGGLLAALGRLAWIQGEYGTAKERFEKALSMLEPTDARRAIMDTQFGLQLEAHRVGDYGKVRQLLEKNLVLAEAIGDQSSVALCWVALGNAAVEELRWDEARENYAKSLDLARRCGDKDRIGHALNNLGNLAVLANQPAAARKWLDEGLALFDEAGYRWHAAMGHLALAKLESLEGNTELALGHLRECLNLASEENLVVWRALLQFGVLFLQMGRDAEATQLFAYVEALREQIGETLIGVEMTPFQESVAVLKTRLSPSDFDQEWLVGQYLTPAAVNGIVLQAAL